MRVGLRRQLTEPWGVLTAGVLGGMGGAAAFAAAGSAAVAAPVALGIAGVVYGVKVAAGLLAERNAPAEEDRLPMPAKGSPAEVWLRRAERAVRTLHEQTSAPVDPTTRGQVGDIDDQAAGMLSDLRRLAAQVASVDAARARVDVARLHSERGHLLGALRQRAAGAYGPAAGSEQDVRAEQERALASIDAQLDVHTRLSAARDTALARMQATAIGLEGLVARLAEVLALAATAGGVDTTADRIGELSDDLEGLRTGLAETEALSRQVLGPGRSGPAG